VGKCIIVSHCNVGLRTQNRSMAIALRIAGKPQAHADGFSLPQQKHGTTKLAE